MKTLPIGGSEFVSLPAYNMLSITVAAGATGSLERLGKNPGDASLGISALTASATVGPFAEPTRHMLRCSPASFMSYDITPADFPAVNSDFERIAKLTQAEYDALSPPDAATLYLIVG
ncbi:MAG: hypothetical protein E5W65_10510 [Mesorhizobium sp.]|uniref:phage upper tail fiber protein n=1 Tax=Mesorhizobium sp. TaxID=1871066 RepID=UPI00120A478C|nr:hypothetical protein [Mesorhizobium sp.]TIT36187.1 MAG: hypothetical protein E5W65_10510 [Mesorhizobium sp.]